VFLEEMTTVQAEDVSQGVRISSSYGRDEAERESRLRLEERNQ